MKNQLYYFYWLLRTYPMRWNFPKYHIMTFEDTVNEIIVNKKGLSRFGDGEFRLLLGKRDIVFQKLSLMLANRLQEVIQSKLSNHIVALPESFVDRKNLIRSAKIHWLSFINSFGKEISSKIGNPNRKFGNAFIGRFYHDYKNKRDVPQKVQLLKKIWQNQDILFVEGEYSRLGIGNDLFSNAKSIERIIAPSADAFEKYAELFEASKKYGENKLIILALGPAATILAYDLAIENFWALDLGHIDIEYSWFLMGAKTKIPVPGKKSAEVSSEESFLLNSQQEIVYKSSILEYIL